MNRMKLLGLSALVMAGLAAGAFAAGPSNRVVPKNQSNQEANPLYGGYLWAYQGIEWADWPMRARVDTFWITSTAALALVSVLFTVMVWHASRPAQTKTKSR